MNLSIGKTFHFDAAHYLPNYTGPCSQMHGHTWTLTAQILVDGYDYLEENMLLDFKDFSLIVHEIIDPFDHEVLNSVLSNLHLDLYPSCENLACLFALQLYNRLQGLISQNYIVSIELQEGEGGFATCQYPE